MNRLALFLSFTIIGLAARVAAQPASGEPRLAVELRPFPEAGPWKRRLAITSRRAQEVVLDRRLLQLTVLEPRERGRPRRHVCRYPSAPTRPREDSVRVMAEGETYEEWLDLRELCWGRPLDALARGAASVEVAYGFRGRGQFVVRQAGERRPPHRVAGTGFVFEAPSSTSASAPVPSNEESSGPLVRVSMAAVSTSAVPSFSVSVRGEGTAAPRYVYLRDDLFSFRVSGPLGSVRCTTARTDVVPIVDFFRRLSRSSRTTLASDYVCPEGTFDVPGVYEVVPEVELVYDGARFDLEAVTGSFVGEVTPVRISSRDYVEQRVEDLLVILESVNEAP